MFNLKNKHNMKKTKRLLSAVLFIALAQIGFSQTNVTTVGGTANYVPVFNGTTTVVNSIIYDNATTVGISNTSPSATYKLDVTGAIHSSTRYYLNGFNALYAPATSNLFCGQSSGGSYASGATYNACFGVSSGYGITTGDYNTCLGMAAGFTTSTTSLNTYVGYNCGYAASGTDCSFFGRNSGQNNTGTNNVFLGSLAGYTNTSAGENFFAGYKCSYLNTTGDTNTFVGNLAGYTHTTASRNTYFGFQAGYSGTTGYDNVLIGHKAGYTLSGSISINNVFIGSLAGYSASTSALQNVMIGYKAGYATTNSQYNSFVGELSGSKVTSGSDNTFFGQAAGYTVTTGSYNTCIGQLADASATISNATAIGANVGVTASNTVVIGDGSVTKWGFGINASSGNIIEFPGGLTAAKLTTGGAWTDASDKNLKANFKKVDGKLMLKTLKEMPITTWNYKADSSSIRHIGPMAQDFYKLFGFGDDKSIAAMDKAGIALVCIQVLSQQMDEQQKQLEQKDSTIKALVNTTEALKNTAELTNGKTNAQADVEVLKKENEELKSQIASINEKLAQFDNSLQQCCFNYNQNTIGNEKQTIVTDKAMLQQNTPNPFSQNTSIKFYIPSTAKTAIIKVYTEQGVELKSFEITQKGVGEITITGNTFKAGTYIYQLIIDGQSIDAKKMQLIN